jgi:RimJ/RimL family protein N-acetyltransferase
MSEVFELQPILEGELLRLRPLRPEDWDDLYAVASDPLIWEQHPIKDRYTEEVFKGLSRFHGYDKEKSEIEIGWTFLARSHWGGRYNTEMKTLMLQYAFRFVKNVIFLVGSQNVRSQRAVEKIGAVRVGSGPRPDGTGQDSLVYRITAPR